MIKLCVLLLSLTLCQLINAGPPTNFTTRLDRFAQCLMTKWQPQMEVPQLTVSVVGNNETWYTRGFGTLINQSTGKTKPVDEYTLFGIGSVTKGFTSALLTKAIASFNSLYEPINSILGPNSLSTYSPFLNEYGHMVDLMSHRTGIMRADALWISQTPINQSETIDWRHVTAELFPRLPGHVTPRDAWLYNNFGYGQIGSYIEQLTNKKYDDVLAEWVLNPLNMSSTIFGHRAARLKTDNIANLYYVSPNTTQGPVLLPTELDDVIDAIAPAGSMQTNAVDMANWLNAQLGNRPDVLSADVLQMLHLVQMAELGGDLTNVYLTPSQTTIDQVYSGYALGWMKYAINGHLTLLHSGGTLGQISLASIFPNENFGVFTSSPAVTMQIHNYIMLWVFYEINYGSAANVFDKTCASDLGELIDEERHTIDRLVTQLSSKTEKTQGVTPHRPTRSKPVISQPTVSPDLADWPATTFVGVYTNSLWGTMNVSLFSDDRYPGATNLLTYGTLQMAMRPQSSSSSTVTVDCQTLDDNPLRLIFPGGAGFMSFDIDVGTSQVLRAGALLDFEEIYFVPPTSASSSSSTGSASGSSSTGSAEIVEEGVSRSTFIAVTAALSAAVVTLFIALCVLGRKIRQKDSTRDLNSIDMRSNLL